MPLKKTKPKTPQQLKETLELIEWRIGSFLPCLCRSCRLEVALYMCQRDAILFAMGKNPKEFCKLILKLKRGRSVITKQQHSHSE